MDQASLLVQRSDARRSFVTREIGGETLIVPVTGHVMDLESIFVLNPVGSRIWELLALAEHREPDRDVVAGEFAVSPARRRRRHGRVPRFAQRPRVDPGSGEGANSMDTLSYAAFSASFHRNLSERAAAAQRHDRGDAAAAR